jgi:hypothetical protein
MPSKILNSTKTFFQEVNIHMSRNWKDKVLFYGKKLGIAVGIALFAALISLFSGLAYTGNAHIEAQYPNNVLLYIDSLINANITYNPFLFPFYWLTGRGLSSYQFLMRSMPISASQYGVVWPMKTDITDDAMLALSVDAALGNIPYNFIILLAVELLKIRRVYFCMLGGILGFPLGGPVGSLIGFFTIVFVVVLIMPRLKKRDYLTDLWNTIARKKQPPLP